jgi:hypothetical protein
MSGAMTIRVAAPLADELLAAVLAEPLPSERRSAALQLVVDASIVVKDVSSVIVAVAAGVRGLRAILDRLQSDAREQEDDVVLTIDAGDGQRSWSLRAGRVDDATKDEIARVLKALEAGERADADPAARGDGSAPSPR